ncbi:hypothetical protein CBFG_03152 [Clostridiales bacterium 1_7_47FAA]|nr:hypothetical protein CBFG_03152 [Clostridiales bacterium 1_7_47FAA]
MPQINSRPTGRSFGIPQISHLISGNTYFVPSCGYIFLVTQREASAGRFLAPCQGTYGNKSGVPIFLYGS